jgi:hypothetical protein
MFQRDSKLQFRGTRALKYENGRVRIATFIELEKWYVVRTLLGLFVR